MQLITLQPSAQFVLMTKPLVDALLAMNTRNRNLRQSVVATYKRTIEKNLWLPTNQGIGVSISGFLIDGQHRLEALREAGYPKVTMLVVTGLADETMAAVDGGVNRNARDYLQFMFDTKVSAFVSATLRTSMLAAVGFPLIKYQPQEYAEHLEKLGGSISELLKLERISKLPAAVFAAIVDTHSNGYQSESIEFAKALLTGEMLAKDNPALVLRNWLATSNGSGGNTAMVERYKKTTRAIQAWIEQRPLAKLYRSKTTLREALEDRVKANNG